MSRTIHSVITEYHAMDSSHKSGSKVCQIEVMSKFPPLTYLWNSSISYEML